jgi:hypothetical protein
LLYDYLDAREIWNLLLYPAPSIGGTMIYIAQRLLRAETEADKEAFVKGLVSLDTKGAEMKFAAGFIAGSLLSKLRKNA